MAGHMKSPRGPYVAHGPQVGQHCIRGSHDNALYKSTFDIYTTNQVMLRYPFQVHCMAKHKKTVGSRW